jgi:hypothetical protein
MCVRLAAFGSALRGVRVGHQVAAAVAAMLPQVEYKELANVLLLRGSSGKRKQQRLPGRRSLTARVHLCRTRSLKRHACIASSVWGRPPRRRL